MRPKGSAIPFLFLSSFFLALTGCSQIASPANQTFPSSKNAGSGQRSSAEGPASGLYGSSLTLIRNPNGSVMGSFFEDAGPAVSCSFLLQSKGSISANGEMPISTWSPDRELHRTDNDELTSGTLVFRDDIISLQLPKKAHGGCWRVEPQLDNGEVFKVGTGKPHPDWKSLRIVASGKLELHHRPDANDLTKAYVVSGDVLAVLGTMPQDGLWHHVQLTTSEGPTATGWVPDSGLLPWSVPSH